MQFMADILELQVDRPALAETTALSHAILAMLGSGQTTTLGQTASLWKLKTSFQPHLGRSKRDTLLAGWQTAIKRTLLDCR